MIRAIQTEKFSETNGRIWKYHSTFYIPTDLFHFFVIDSRAFTCFIILFLIRALLPVPYIIT